MPSQRPEVNTGGACSIQKGPSTLTPTLIWVPPVETERAQLALGWGRGVSSSPALYPWLAGVGGLAPPGWRSRQGETRAGQVVSREQEMMKVYCIK